MDRRNGYKVMTIQDFDIIEFLQDFDILHDANIKNVGQGWVGLEECPFCSGGGYHFGVNEYSKGFSCWICGESGHIQKLIMALLHISKRDTYDIITKYSGTPLKSIPRKPAKEIILPSRIVKIGNYAKRYLAKRHFTQEHIDKYNLQDTGKFSEVDTGSTIQNMKYRIFIPFYASREMMSYTCRDYASTDDPKYKHPVIEAVITSPAATLYNIDTVVNKCIIVEGPTDVWRMGNECISLQGVTYTDSQITQIAQRKLKKIVVLFDEHAEDKADKLANALYGHAKSVHVAYLESGDPADLDDVEALKIKRQLLYNT